MKKKPKSVGRKVAKAKSKLAFYTELLGDIKSRIGQAQTRAALAANAELIRLYWDIGRMIHQRQTQRGWGAGVIPRLSRDLRNELPELKGFSERNIKLMVQFVKEYPWLFPFTGPQHVARLSAKPIGQPPVAQLRAQLNSLKNSPPPGAESTDFAIGQLPVAQLPWAHNVILIQKLKELSTRLWYMRQTLAHGWSRDYLAAMIKSNAHERQGRAVTNFADTLPQPQSKLAAGMLKDPYIFDFLTMEEHFHERELETGLVKHVEKFLLELGQGFAFVGRQYLLTVGDDEFYLDLLFYHLRLRCFVVIDLKRGKFKPEYAGKMNFYCSTADAQLRHKTDRPTIGLILCQTKDRIIAEYALRDINKPIGIAEYELTRALPKTLASRLPSIEQIETELQSELDATD